MIFPLEIRRFDGHLDCCMLLAAGTLVAEDKFLLDTSEDSDVGNIPSVGSGIGNGKENRPSK